MNDSATLQISGLHGIELDELHEMPPAGSVIEANDPDRPPGHFGEPALITAAVLAGAAVVQALSAWLSRRAARAQVAQGFTIVVEADSKVRIALSNVAAPSTDQNSPSTAAEIAKSIKDALTTNSDTTEQG